MFRPTRTPSSGLQGSKRLTIACVWQMLRSLSLLELYKPDDGFRVGRNMSFH